MGNKADLDSLSREEAIEMCKKLMKQNADLEKNCNIYLEQLKKNKQKMSGKSKEKSSLILQDELQLFDEADVMAEQDKEEESVNIAEYKRRKKKKYTIDNLPKNVEKEYIEYDLEDKQCPTCGNQMHKIKVEERYEIKMIPAQVKLIVHQIPVYACRKCQKKGSGTLIKANGPAMLFPKSLASASLVSYLMDMKYNKGVPIYRIEQSTKQEGILFPRNTYARWMIESSDQYLEKVYEQMHEHLLKEEIIHADETKHTVFTDGRKDSEAKNTYVWTFRTGKYTKHPIVLYVHKGGRKGEIAETFLNGYHDYLLTDDYAGYNGVHAIRVFCHAHVRRKFADIVKGQKGAGSVEIATEVIHKYQKIFNTDKAIRERNGKNINMIKTDRNKEIRPLTDELFTYLKDTAPKVAPKTELYKAINYALDNEKELYGYFDDGRLELTNNLAERTACF
ncbi:IS66 family transposase [Erysipelotrichaceae bacterium HCN-30851]